MSEQTPKGKLLIVDDESKIRALIRKYAEYEGYQVEEAADGMEAVTKAEEEDFDIIIMDIMMPEMDGFTACREIRKKKQTPMLMLSARGEEYDKIHGFELGIDDYMVKPINVNELLLRVGALLRRAQIINERRLVVGDTVMECDSLTVTSGGQSMILPQKEFMLLYKMASYPGRIFTRQQLMDDIWGYESETNTHTVDVHIGRLRDRFKDNRDFRIVTMRGLGYKVEKT